MGHGNFEVSLLVLFLASLTAFDGNAIVEATNVFSGNNLAKATIFCISYFDEVIVEEYKVGSEESSGGSFANKF